MAATTVPFYDWSVMGLFKDIEKEKQQARAALGGSVLGPGVPQAGSTLGP